MTEVHILIQESALEEMLRREARLQRDWARLREDLAALQKDIEQKRCDISRARNAYLQEHCNSENSHDL